MKIVNICEKIRRQIFGTIFELTNNSFLDEIYEPVSGSIYATISRQIRNQIEEEIKGNNQ